MDCAEAGRKGGSSKSAKKSAASARNLEAARELRRGKKESWLEEERRQKSFAPVLIVKAAE
jgi:hypothetical protein